jgi:hypothetical protein
MQYKIENVEALWPRINRTYKFDSNERKSVPCDPKDPLAAYDMSFRMTKEQAQALWKEMCKAYKDKADPSWPDKPVNPFKEDEGFYIGKAKLKGNYNGEPTKKPKHYDAKGIALPDDFMLTTGSMVNVAVTFTPYNMREAGVSLRLRAVQVLRYNEPEDRNPFEEVAGYSGITDTTNDDFAAVQPVANVFGDDEPAPKPAPAKASMDFDDEIPF